MAIEWLCVLFASQDLCCSKYIRNESHKESDNLLLLFSTSLGAPKAAGAANKRQNSAVQQRGSGKVSFSLQLIQFKSVQFLNYVQLTIFRFNKKTPCHYF